MLPLFNLRLFRNNNLTILQPFIDKMKRNELTLENILEEDDIIQDLKNNKNSQFSSFFSNENIRKLIDYATKMPRSDDKKIGYKYPFNATELLCSDNIGIMERFMNEFRLGGDSDDDEDEKDEGEKENNEEGNETNEKVENDEQDNHENENVDKKKEEENSEKKSEKNNEGGEQEQEKEKEENKKEEEAKKEEEPKNKQ